MNSSEVVHKDDGSFVAHAEIRVGVGCGDESHSATTQVSSHGTHPTPIQHRTQPFSQTYLNASHTPSMRRVVSVFANTHTRSRVRESRRNAANAGLATKTLHKPDVDGKIVIEVLDNRKVKCRGLFVLSAVERKLDARQNFAGIIGLHRLIRCGANNIPHTRCSRRPKTDVFHHRNY